MLDCTSTIAMCYDETQNTNSIPASFQSRDTFLGTFLLISSLPSLPLYWLLSRQAGINLNQLDNRVLNRPFSTRIVLQNKQNDTTNYQVVQFQREEALL